MINLTVLIKIRPPKEIEAEKKPEPKKKDAKGKPIEEEVVVEEPVESIYEKILLTLNLGPR
jgi:hypothetical protein